MTNSTWIRRRIIKTIFQQLNLRCSVIFGMLTILISTSTLAAPVLFETTTKSITDIPITTWKEMRDAQVVKQDLRLFMRRIFTIHYLDALLSAASH